MIQHYFYIFPRSVGTQDFTRSTFRTDPFAKYIPKVTAGMRLSYAYTLFFFSNYTCYTIQSKPQSS